jgi:hypothetical protein
MISRRLTVTASALAVVGCVGIGSAALAAPALRSPGPAPRPAGSAPAAPCSANYVHGPLRAARRLRFGIDPELAGTAGTTQESAKPVNQAKALGALRALRPPGKELVVRVNRLFESDGEAGIRRFEAIIKRYTRAGYDTELQVRYHPSAGERGKMGVWTRYVRRVVDTQIATWSR